MKYRIGIVELAHHNEILRSYILGLLNGGFDITIFTNPFNFDQIYDFQNHPNIQWEIMEKDESFSRFKNRCESSMNSCELLLVTTIPKKFWPGLSFPVPTVHTIINNHYLFEPSKHFSASSGVVDNTRDIIKNVLFYLLNQKKKNKRFLNTFDHLAAPSQSVLEYMKAKPYLEEYPYDTILDYAVFDKDIELAPVEDVCTISIPGIVSNKSRDYHLVWEVLKKLDEKLNQKIRIHLLGKPKGAVGKKHVKEIQSLSGNHLEIITYQNFIHQKEFDRVMRKTDFLFLPILAHSKFDICLEKTGYSCVSGNINDMVKYGLPAILPSFYPLEEPMKQMVKTYNIAFDIPDMILDWIQSKEYLKIREKRNEILEPLGAKALGKKFVKQIENLIVKTQNSKQ